MACNEGFDEIEYMEAYCKVKGHMWKLKELEEQSRKQPGTWYHARTDDKGNEVPIQPRWYQNSSGRSKADSSMTLLW